jgi:hypothetical protein
MKNSKIYYFFISYNLKSIYNMKEDEIEVLK